MEAMLIIPKEFMDRIERQLVRLEQLEKERSDDEKFLTIEEASAYCHCTKSNLYNLTHTGEIAFSKVGKKNIFKKSDLDKYIKSRRRSSNSELQQKAENVFS